MVAARLFLLSVCDYRHRSSTSFSTASPQLFLWARYSVAHIATLSARAQGSIPLASQGRSHSGSAQWDILFLLMSVSIGGLGALGLRKSMTGVASIATTTGDIRSLLCLVIFCIVFLVLGQSYTYGSLFFKSGLTLFT